MRQTRCASERCQRTRETPPHGRPYAPRQHCSRSVEFHGGLEGVAHFVSRASIKSPLWVDAVEKVFFKSSGSNFRVAGASISFLRESSSDDELTDDVRNGAQGPSNGDCRLFCLSARNWLLSAWGLFRQHRSKCEILIPSRCFRFGGALLVRPWRESSPILP
jgi:hypothetical protein